MTVRRIGDFLHIVNQQPEVAPASERTVCQICNGAGYYTLAVGVEDSRYGQLVVCECKRREIEARRYDDLLARSRLLEMQRKQTFDTWSPATPRLAAAGKVAQQYAASPAGTLLLHGEHGGGKTHLAAAVVNARLALGDVAVFVVVPDLLDYLRAAYDPRAEAGHDDYFAELRDCPLLALDDLGKESPTPWVTQKLYQLINHRYNRELPTVVTTNLKPGEIDISIRGRLTEMGRCRPICLVPGK